MTAPRPLTVWHLSSNRWNSAITEYALSAARALELAGHRSVFSPLAGSPAEKRCLGYGLAVKPVARFAFGDLPRLKAAASEIKPDVIITYGGPETFLSRFLKGSACVYRFRGQAIKAEGFAFASRHKLAHAHVEAVITPSEAMAKELRAIDPARPAVCVPLGVDAQKYRNLRGEMPISTKPEVVILGRLDPVKGHETLMQLFARVKELALPTGLEPVLHVVGEPANLSVTHIEAYARNAGLKAGKDVVITAARVPNIERLMNEAALGIVPSLGSEVICRVAEEFLLCGTPVVVSGVGSLDEVLAFEGAGASYRGKRGADAAAVIHAWLRRSLAEPSGVKAERARSAAERFALEAMGRNLAQLLFK